MKILLIPLILALCSCATFQKTAQVNFSDLNFYGKATLSIEKPEELWLSDGPTLISKNNDSISYGVITQEHLKFIGTESSPSDFLTLSFSGAGNEAEKNFFQAFKGYDIAIKNEGGATFYELGNSNDKYIYIASDNFNFIIEIYSKSPEGISLSNIAKRFKLTKQGE